MNSIEKGVVLIVCIILLTIGCLAGVIVCLYIQRWYLAGCFALATVIPWLIIVRARTRYKDSF